MEDNLSLDPHEEIEVAKAGSFNQATTDTDGDGVYDNLDVDDDNDGLIEIYYLEELDNIRYNMRGTSYKTGSTDSGTTAGTPSGGLRGYELMRSLDFADPGSYVSGEVNPSWIPETGDVETSYSPGWLPIGNSINNNKFENILFETILEGNGNTIENLYIKNVWEDYVGLIGTLSSIAEIRNLGLVNNNARGRRHVGGLAGINWGTITASYTTGEVRGTSFIGALVGYNYGTITASHTTGEVRGTSSIGALVGYNNGTITASYATGDVSGASSSFGGLVGRNTGTITACYATGDVSGRTARSADIGGLVGHNRGTITASYAIGEVSGISRVGGLVGLNGYRNKRSGTASITASYAIGEVSGTSSFGGLVGVNNGTASESYWDREESGREASPGGTGLSTAEMKATGGVYPNFGSFSPAWQADGVCYPRVKTWVGVGEDNTPGTTDDSYDETLLPRQERDCFPDGDGDGIVDLLDIDNDNDGLIDINTLEDLNNIRHNLEGTSYRTNALDPGDVRGAPQGTLRGYELMRDLDFADPGSYASGEVNPSWRPEGGANPGWEPLGDREDNAFSAILEGNGHTIKNLYIKRSTQIFVGLIGYLDTGGEIRNLGLVGSKIEGKNIVGGLVGHNCGVIIASYAVGEIKGNTILGGIAGYNTGTIAGSYATVKVEGNIDVGGIAGYNLGAIAASYSTGSVGGIERVGGIAGGNSFQITASYAIGRVRGFDNTGGLVGYNLGTIAASYWDIQSTEQTTSSGGGRGLIPAEMKATGGVYPDFGSSKGAWKLREGSYPRLKTWSDKGKDNRVGTSDDNYRESPLSGQGDDLGPTEAITPPEALRNVRANIRGSGGIQFSWLNPSEPGYAGVLMEWKDDQGRYGRAEFGKGYMTHQRDSSGREYSYPGESRYRNPFKLGRDYKVKLYVYDESRNLSEAVSMEIPLSEAEIPPTPTNAIYQEVGDKIRMSWERGGEGEVDGYLVFFVVHERKDRFYYTSGEGRSMEIDRESIGLGADTNYSFIVCSFKNLEQREEGSPRRARASSAGGGSAAMSTVSDDTTANSGGGGGNPPPPPPPDDPDDPPTLTIGVTNVACPGGTIMVSISGDNLEGKEISITDGANLMSSIVGPGTVSVTMPTTTGNVTLMASTDGASDSKMVAVYDILSIRNDGKTKPVYAEGKIEPGLFNLLTTTTPSGHTSDLGTSFTFMPSKAPTPSGAMSEQTVTISREGCPNTGKKAVSITADIMVVNKDWWSDETTYTIPWPTSIENIVLFFERAIPNYEGGHSSRGSINGEIKEKYGKRIRDCEVLKLNNISGSVSMQIASFSTPRVTLVGMPYVASIDAFLSASADASLSAGYEYFEDESGGVNFDARVGLTAGGSVVGQVLSGAAISADLSLETIIQVQAGL